MQNERLTHPQDIDGPWRLAAERKINSYRPQYADNQNISFSPPLSAPPPACTANFCVFFFYRPTGRPRRTSLPLECHRNAAAQPIGLVPFQAHSILPVAEEQSLSRAGQSGAVPDQPQCRGLWHSSRPSARSFTRSPSSPPPSFTQSPSPPRSLVRDGQTSPHRPRLVSRRLS